MQLKKPKEMKRDASITDRKLTFDRTLTIERLASGDDDKTVTFSASLSSEKAVERFFGTETLIHTKEAINMERAAEGLPLLWNHNTNEFIGRVNNIRLEGKKLRGELEFSDSTERARSIRQDVDSGMLKSISIRYSIQDWVTHERKGQPDRVEITRWMPLETSVVSVPADNDVGIGRKFLNNEGVVMKKDENGNIIEGVEGDGGVVAKRSADDDPIDLGNFKRTRDTALSEGQKKGAQIERERILEINDIFNMPSYETDEFNQLRLQCIQQGVSPDQTRKAVLNMLGNTLEEPIVPSNTLDTGFQKPPIQTQSRGASYVTEDEVEKLGGQAERALEFRLDMTGNKKEDRKKLEDDQRGNPFAQMTIPEMARLFLNRSGVNTDGWTKEGLIKGALMPNHAVSLQRAGGLVGLASTDLPSLLSNTAEKSLLLGYEEAPEVWQRMVRIGQLPDYKTADRVGLSTFDDLAVVPESGEYKHGSFTDIKEQLKISKYGKLFAVTRESLVNDDLAALSTVPRKMGRAASRKVGDVVANIFINNPLMVQDGVALFAAGHNNQKATGGTAPTIASVDLARVAMGKQTDPGQNAKGLNIPIFALVVPLALETTARVLRRSEFDPGATGNTRSPNPFQDSFEVIADARFDANSATKWYVIANPNLFDVIEVAFLNGRQEPFLDSRDGWNVDGIEYKVRHEFDAKPMDFRTFYFNNGA